MTTFQEKFEEMLTNMFSTNDHIRMEAETAYDGLSKDQKVSHLLLTILNDHATEECRLMAAILVRRLFKKCFFECYHRQTPEGKQQLLEQILLCVKQSVSPNLKRAICEVVAETATHLIDEESNNQWPEISLYLYQCIYSNSTASQECAMRIFALVPNIFGNHESNYFIHVKQMTEKYLNNTSPIELRFETIRAIFAFIIFYEKQATVFKHFSNLLPVIIDNIAESIEQEQDKSLVEHLIELTECCPQFLAPQLEIIFDLCLRVFCGDDVDDEWRFLVLEVMVSLAENGAVMVRQRANKYIKALIPLILEMMTDVEEYRDWLNPDVVIDEDNNEKFTTAELGLNRLTCGLGGKTVFPLIKDIISSLLSSPDWKKRYSGLTAISAIGEGCRQQMIPRLSNILNAVIYFIRDAHPQVRCAACNTIARMSISFKVNLKNYFHDKVLPAILCLFDDVQNPRAQVCAGIGIIYFTQDLPKNILTKHLDAIMAKLGIVLNAKFHELLQTGSILVLQQVIQTIASIADKCDKQFIIYYDRFIPLLKLIIKNAKTKELEMLRGQSMECMSYIGLAVGREVFINEAVELMDTLIKSHLESGLTDDDPQMPYVISICTRTCKVLGKQFEPYIPFVMGPVLTHCDIQKSGLEDKSAICEMLLCFARELEEGFADYCGQVARLMVPMLSFYCNDIVRTLAAESLPVLLNCAKTKGEEFVKGMWAYICPELLKAIATEIELDVQGQLLESLSSCIITLGENCLSEEAIKDILKIVTEFLEYFYKKLNNTLRLTEEEDNDEGNEETVEEEDHGDAHILPGIAHIVHALFVTYKTNFIKYFQQIVFDCAKLLDPTFSWEGIEWGLHIFNDLIKYTGPFCSQYQKLFLPHMLKSISHPSPRVRFAALYGWGLLGQFGNQQFALTCAQVMPFLINMITDNESLNTKNISATEKAISAITKILKYNSSALRNINQILHIWFAFVPVVKDKKEAVHIYTYLCDLIESNNIIILGNNYSNLPRILSIFAEAFRLEVIDAHSEEGFRMIHIVKNVVSSQEISWACFAKLNPEQQEALEKAYKESSSK